MPDSYAISDGYLRLTDVMKELDHVDDADVLVRAASSPALMCALELSRPRNWWGIGIDPLALFELSRNAGIPLCWVPRQEIIKELAAAQSRSGLAAVLIRRSTEVIEDCTAAVDECVDERLHGSAPLARAAIDAYRNGHREAAMALAVSLSEPLAAWASTPRVTTFDSPGERNEWEKRREEVKKYRWAELELGAGPPDKRFSFPAKVIMAPIPRFFTKWFPDSGDPPPETLSRHVVAHQPTVEHFNAENCLLAIMLMASLLRQQQDWCDELGPSDGDSEA